MLGSALPATASVHTTTSAATPTSPTRPSRLRGLSYLRTYTRDHLHSNSSRVDSPPLTRSTSTPAESLLGENRKGDTERSNHEASSIQAAEQGWLPSVQGRSGLSRESLDPSSSTESAVPEPTPSSIPRTRSRAATAIESTLSPTGLRYAQPSAENMSSGDDPAASASSPVVPGGGKEKEPLPTIRFIPHVEARASRPSLHFVAVSRTLKQVDNIVRLGRYSERDTTGHHDQTTVTPVGFKSKVVSRRHCEFWCTDGQWYIKDVKSSSGTFLNHVRLSSPGVESRPYPVNDGDVVQLGIDFKGGEEVIFRCVKIRIECNRGWQKSLNSFNTSAHKRLLKSAGVSGKIRDSDAASTHSSECSICLNPVAPCQALFVAPCSHVWHYKCIRNLIHGPNYPNFLCPNCRYVADLDAEVEQPEDASWEDDVDGGAPQDMRDEAKELSSENETGDPNFTPEGSDEQDREDAPTRRSATRSDEELSRSMESASLSVHDDTNRSSSQPMNIAARPNRGRTPSTDILSARSATPTSNTQFALAAGMMSLHENGPMTPRNDAGPFVLDGGASRGIAEQALAEVNEPASPRQGG